MNQIASDILGPIKRGESVSTIWVPMAGRRVVTKYIIENIQSFSSVFPEYKNYLLVYFEPLELTEESSRGYLKLLGESLISVCLKNSGCDEVLKNDDVDQFKKEGLSYSHLLTALSGLISKIADRGFKIIFFLGEFDELNFANTVFYNNLKLLWMKFSTSMQYVFLNREKVTTEEKISLFGDLNEVLLQNIIPVPVMTKEADYLVKRICSKYDRKFSEEEKSLIKELCGAHPYLIVVASRHISRLNGEKFKKEELRAQLLKHYEMNAVARGIIDAQTENDKKLLKNIALGEVINNIPDRSMLEKLGLVVQDKNGQWKIFCEIVKKVAGTDKPKEYSPEVGSGIAYDVQTGAVIYKGLPAEENFTTQEYNLLIMFLKDPNVLKSRDDIGEVLWGKDPYEKYSDWAIDQLISKLRKKLTKLGTKSTIVTVRGRGYKLVLADSKT